MHGIGCTLGVVISTSFFLLSCVVRSLTIYSSIDIPSPLAHLILYPILSVNSISFSIQGLFFTALSAPCIDSATLPLAGTTYHHLFHHVHNCKQYAEPDGWQFCGLGPGIGRHQFCRVRYCPGLLAGDFWHSDASLYPAEREICADLVSAPSYGERCKVPFLY